MKIQIILCITVALAYTAYAKHIQDGKTLTCLLSSQKTSVARVKSLEGSSMALRMLRCLLTNLKYQLAGTV